MCQRTLLVFSVESWLTGLYFLLQRKDARFRETTATWWSLRGAISAQLGMAWFAQDLKQQKGQRTALKHILWQVSPFEREHPEPASQMVCFPHYPRLQGSKGQETGWRHLNHWETPLRHCRDVALDRRVSVLGISRVWNENLGVPEERSSDFPCLPFCTTYGTPWLSLPVGKASRPWC